MTNIDSIIGGLAIFMAILFIAWYNLPSKRTARKIRRENEQRAKAEEERKEKVATEEGLDYLRRKRIFVHITRKDGSRSHFETIMIKELIKLNIKVENLESGIHKKIKFGEIPIADNALLIMGTYWEETKHNRGSENTDPYDYQVGFFDYRVIDLSSSDRFIVLANWMTFLTENKMAISSINQIAREIPRTATSVTVGDLQRNKLKPETLEEIDVSPGDPNHPH